MTMIDVRLGVQQRVYAAYRQPFFEALAAECWHGMSLFAGTARPGEQIPQSDALENGSFYPAKNHHLFSGGMYLCWQSGLLGWAKSFDPQVLIVEANPRYLNLRQVINLVHDRGGRVIGWGLGSPEVLGLNGVMIRRLRQRLYTCLDAIITYSQQGASEYHAAGIPADRIFIAPNAAVDRQDFPLPDRPDAYYQDRPTILFVGRLQERKRVDLLIKACSRLNALAAPRLWIVGDGPERQMLESLAMTCEAEVTFFGSKFGEELADLYQQADLFVLPGTGGLALQQAMSHGLPVMAAEADGTQLELVREGNGWLLPPGDVDALNDILQSALENLPALRLRGAESYRIVNEEINISGMVSAFSNAVAAVKAGI